MRGGLHSISSDDDWWYSSEEEQYDDYGIRQDATNEEKI